MWSLLSYSPLPTTCFGSKSRSVHDCDGYVAPFSPSRKSLTIVSFMIFKHLLYKTVACLYGPASAVQQVVDLFAYWHPMAFPGEKDAPRNSEAAGGDAKQDSGIVLMSPTDFCTGLWMSLLMLRDCNGPPKSNGRIAVNDSIPQTDGGPQGSVKASKGSRPSTPSFSFFNIRGEKTVVEPENQKVEYVAIKDLKDIFFWD